MSGVGPPKLGPPKMKVGLNHGWAFNRYGSSFGPHEAWVERWFDQLPGNLHRARHAWGVTHVRMFLLCNGYNYGAARSRGKRALLRSPFGGGPILRAPDDWRFDPPARLEQKFLDDFVRVLKAFRDAGCQLIPSLLDFGAFGPTAAGGKRDLVVDPVKRRLFLDSVLDPFLDASAPFREQIYAWEVMNEPSWTTRAFAKPLAYDKQGVLRYAPDLPILSDSALEGFLASALQRIEARGFPSTVGHRSYGDMLRYPAGTRRQFHFYAWPFLDNPGLGIQARIPRYELPGGLEAAENVFVGEVGTGTHGLPWPELHGRDARGARASVFARLELVARKGYPLALLWGNEAWGAPRNLADAVDTWEFSAEAIQGLTDFTQGLFPDGVP
jgi:hypothetical protein